VVAELPGMEQKDIELTLHEGMLTLKGEKKSEINGAVYSGAGTANWSAPSGLASTSIPTRSKPSSRTAC
jgi:hypothetical protein